MGDRGNPQRGLGVLYTCGPTGTGRTETDVQTAQAVIAQVAPGSSCAAEVHVPGRLLGLRGRLDVHSAADVRMLLVDAVPAADGDLVLDCSGLTALDATGLGVLVGGHRRAQRAGRVLVLQDVTPAVGRLLLLTRLDKVLRTVRSVAVA